MFSKINENGIRNSNPYEIDVIITHTPGTKKGDIAE